MTLDEAIKHYLDIADGQDKCAEISVSEHAKERINQCATDHRQLAEWLRELKAYTGVIEHIKQRMYETALNSSGNWEDAGKTIEDIADRIDNWVEEYKQGGK